MYTDELEVQLIQPWSVPVFKTTLPPDILQTMIEISDKIIADKDVKSWGEHLVGQIDSELLIKPGTLEQAGVMGFFMEAVCQFIIQCKMQQRVPMNSAEYFFIT